ncbi:tyrosine-protein phosphatase [Nocardia sp. 2]|uniref:Tyrosine-protein phosphatase n=1 Tax=Nocardia acididurans TaxID=2802282 RepID=A0ABS1MD31_9NOCA|nr:tyrosine-protein phosphatase [Nocardia acididurans]MBL1078479.1 tyrosine-protein phosphatase [Nocardia acididurans]
MTTSRAVPGARRKAVRGTLIGAAAALITLVPVVATPALAAPDTHVLHQAPATGLVLTAAPNARDIGGTAATGGSIKNGLVYRSDALNRLTDADQASLAANVTTVIDFRSPTERQVNPNKIPAGVTVKELPVYDPGNDFYLFFAQTVQGGPAVQQQVLGDGKNIQLMQDYNRWFVTDASSRAQFGTALHEIANASGAVLFHCTQGKDRTGLMTAILMGILGTPETQIYNNYLLSNDKLAAGNKAMLDALVAQGLIQDRTLFEPVLGVQREFLAAALDQIKQSYGSMDAFVTNGLGVDAATQTKLRDKLIQKGGIGTGSFDTGTFK